VYLTKNYFVRGPWPLPAPPPHPPAPPLDVGSVGKVGQSGSFQGNFGQKSKTESVIRDGNGKKTEKWISEFVFVRIRSVSTLTSGLICPIPVYHT